MKKSIKLVMVASTLLVLTACGSMGDLAKGLPGGDLIAAGAKAKELADKAEKFNENIAKTTTEVADSKAAVAQSQIELEALQAQEVSAERDTQIAELEAKMLAQSEELAQVEAKLKGYQDKLAEIEKLKSGEGLTDGFKNPLDEMKEAQTEIDSALAAEKAAAEAKATEAVETAEAKSAEAVETVEAKATEAAEAVEAQ